MFKKLILGTLLASLIGILVAGAIIRTQAKTETTSEYHGQKRGSGNQIVVDGEQDEWQGQPRGNGRASDEETTGQAEVTEWITVEGIVASVDETALVVSTIGGTEIVIESRPWSFAWEQGIALQPGTEITLIGFYESDAFEVGQIQDADGNPLAVLRDENGRPMWAGRGRRTN